MHAAKTSELIGRIFFSIILLSPVLAFFIAQRLKPSSPKNRILLIIVFTIALAFLFFTIAWIFLTRTNLRS